LLDELRELGECVVTADCEAVPELELLRPERSYLAWNVTLTTDRPRDAIEDVFIFLRDDMELAITRVEVVGAENDAPAPAHMPVAATPQLANEPAPQAARPALAAETSSLRVSAERLDELMDRVGELVIAQARLSQLATGSNDPSIKTVAEEIERLAAGLRDTTMGIRMLPIGTLFGRFRRLVHDLAGTLGKQVEFVASGEETELDKTMIERLADPLVHIIRNAVDHGLENPAARQAAGKPAQGRVRLSAVHTGAEVAISVTDDGAGLNLERIRAKAEQAGLIAPDAAVSAHELRQFIFHPGFSTAAEITSVSGRGVGMDVVQRTIDALRGHIEVDSAVGEGTTVTLRLPLTLAIIEGMLVRVGQGRYSIPLSAVEECVELPASAAVAASGGGRNFLNIRGKLVPFLRLRELFRSPGSEEPFQKVVIVSAGEQRVGLVVDQMLGNSQAVIKSLSKLHASAQGFSGATILGDGTVALILDVPHLVRFGQSMEEALRAAPSRRAA
ncbi:MAG: chemotaxis protein CheA, partial [Devosia sp.]